MGDWVKGWGVETGSVVAADGGRLLTDGYTKRDFGRCTGSEANGNQQV